MKQIKFIALKEVYHILRDPKSLAIVFVMPLMMTLLYGYAINMDVESVTLATIDHDRSEMSRQLVQHIYASDVFNEPESEVSLADPEALLRSSDADAVLIIRPGLADAMSHRRPFELGLMVDGSDNNRGAAAGIYVDQVVSGFVREQLLSGIEVPQVDLSVRMLYNSDLESAHFFVPGLIAVILMMISALLTSVTIAREKESGTLRQLLTAPVTPSVILMGKIIPYVVIAFADGILVVIFARVVFDVPFAGSHLLLLGFGLIYVTAALSSGILISTLVSTQQVAMMVALVATMLPSVMLSGLIFAVKNMPVPLQMISSIVPATYFVKIMRGVMLKGAGLDVLATQGGILLVFMITMIVLAGRRFRAGVK